jgi:predicted DNA-binding protein (UPF0251 family)
MPRPRKKRLCRRFRADRVYKPRGIPLKNIGLTTIDLDEFEAMRLCDRENMTQEAAGGVMNISRGTVQRLLYEGRKKIVEAILNNSAIIINLKKCEEKRVSMYSDQRKRRSCRYRQ